MVEEYQRKDIRHRQKLMRTQTRTINQKANGFPGRIYNADFLSLALRRSPDGCLKQVLIKFNTFMEEKDVVERLVKAFTNG